MRLVCDDRTTLRSPSSSDGELLFALIDRHREYLRRWLPWVDHSTSADHTRAFLAAASEAAAAGRSLTLVIEHEREVCGTAGLNWIDSANAACEIGYWLRADRQGRGIVTACCRALVRHAFDELKLNSVRIAVALDNTRSRRIPERLGFAQDGVIREGERLQDGFVDLALYTFLRRDRDSTAGS